MSDLGRNHTTTRATTDSSFTERLGELLFDSAVPQYLGQYFAEPDEGAAVTYTGRHFERFAGRGDRPDHADVVTAEDLVAVQTLSVVMPAEASVQLLEGHLGVEVNRLLQQIPADVPLGNTNATAHVADGSPADRCWKLLTREDQVGATIAGKMLARKRRT